MKGKFCHRAAPAARDTETEKTRNAKRNTEFTEKNWRAQRKPD
jgi:hypothetical protein